MRKLSVPHFYGAYSALGNQTNLYDSAARKPQPKISYGVKNAPDYILTDTFLKRFSNFVRHDKTFLDPRTISKDASLQVIAEQYIQFAELINKTIKPREIQTVIGGDNSVTFASLLALLRREKNPKEIGVIIFDSHGDIHKKNTSPSGNFQGMYLRPFFDTFDNKTVDAYVKKKIPLTNLIYVGNLTLEPEERVFINKNKILELNKETLKNRMDYALTCLTEFVKRYKHIHISLDPDVLDKSIMPAVQIPAENGLLLEHVLPLLKIIPEEAKSFSVDLSEIDPKKRGIKRTVEVAHKMLYLLLTGQTL